jgi:hypothetical protein
VSELSDRDLETQLNRRRSATPLEHGQRADLIETIHARMATVGRASGWLHWRWLAGAAIATALVVVVSIALPRVVSGPSAFPSPTLVAPKSLVMSVDEFAAAARDPGSIDRVVLARVTLDTRTITERFIRPCTWTSVCPIAVVAGVEPELLVVANPPAGDSSQAGPPAIPSGEAVMAFRVREHDVEYLGQSAVAANDQAWSVSDLVSQAHTADPNLLYAVSGWLVRTQIPSCPAPADFSSNPDLSYYCDGSWVTPEKLYSVTGRTANSINSRLTFNGALHVQSDAYNEFARQPQFGELGAEPRRGAYLVRVAGCPADHTGDCPVWKMLGRLDPVPSEQAPSPSPETQTGLAVMTASELVAKTADQSATGNLVISNATISTALVPTWLDPPGLNVVGAVGAGDGSSVLVMGNSLPDATSTNHAFRILDEALQYLGPVALTADDSSWTVPNAISVAPADATEDLYPVVGWLLQTMPAPCAAPPDMSSPQDYWCGGSWITSQQSSVTRMPTSAALIIEGGIHVQWPAYQDFALDPRVGADGGEPRFGTYLIRPVGCPINVMGDCPVWEMVGRLDPPMTVAPPTPSATMTAQPSKTASGPAEPRLDPAVARKSTDQLLGIAAGSLAVGESINVTGSTHLSVHSISADGVRTAIGQFTVPDGISLTSTPLDQRTAGGRVGPTGYLALAAFRSVDRRSQLLIYDLADPTRAPLGPFETSQWSWSPRGLLAIWNFASEDTVSVIDPTTGEMWVVRPEFTRGLGYHWTDDGAAWVALDIREDASPKLGVIDAISGEFRQPSAPPREYVDASYLPADYSAAGEELMAGGLSDSEDENGPAIVVTAPAGESDSLDPLPSNTTVWFDTRTDPEWPMWKGWDTDGTGILAIFQEGGQLVLARFDIPGERQTLGIIDNGPLDPATDVWAIHQAPGALVPDVLIGFANRDTLVWYSGAAGTTQMVSNAGDTAFALGWILGP